MARCRHCWQSGHNRRTCPSLTEQMKYRADRMIESGQSDHWMVKQYQDRISPKGKKISQQTCGYCEGKGHTRRKCDVLQSDMEWFAKHHNNHVRLAHDYIVTSYIGIGSLFKVGDRVYDRDTGEYSRKNIMHVLTGFHVNTEIIRGNMRIWATLTNPINGEERSINIRDYIKDPKHSESYWSPSVLVSAETQVIPSDWVFNQSVTVESLGTHPHFIRSGQKRNDVRDWDFRERSSAIETIQLYENATGNWEQNRVAEAKKTLEKYTVKHNRAKIFKDFKSEE